MKKSTNLGLFFGFAAGLLWSFTFLAPKISGKFSSTEILLGRYISFFIISLFFFSLRKIYLFFKENPSFLKEALIITIVGFSGYYFLLIEAVRLIGVPVTSFTMGMVPVTIILFSGNFKKNLKLYALPLLCIILGMLTLVLNDQSADESPKTTGEMIMGGILALASLSSWTYYALRNARFLKEHPKVKSKDWASALGILALPTVLLFLIIETGFRAKSFYIVEASTEELWLFLATSLAIGVGSSWLATICWNIAGTMISKELLGQMVVSETCFAIVLNVIYEKRFFHPAELVAVTLLSLGVALASSPSFVKKQINRWKQNQS